VFLNITFIGELSARPDDPVRNVNVLSAAYCKQDCIHRSVSIFSESFKLLVAVVIEKMATHRVDSRYIEKNKFEYEILFIDDNLLK